MAMFDMIFVYKICWLYNDYKDNDYIDKAKLVKEALKHVFYNLLFTKLKCLFSAIRSGYIINKTHSLIIIFVFLLF